MKHLNIATLFVIFATQLNCANWINNSDWIDDTGGLLNNTLSNEYSAIFDIQDRQSNNNAWMPDNNDQPMFEHKMINLAFTEESTEEDVSLQVDEVNIVDLAFNILDEVLKYQLKTANSIAATAADGLSLVNVRKNHNNVFFISDEGNVYADINNAYEAVAANIKAGVSNCAEYGLITFFKLLNNNFENPHQQISIYLMNGVNFDHTFVAIGRPSDNIDDLIVIDPWLRKVVYLSEMQSYLRNAGIKLSEGTEYLSQVVYILGEYNHAIHNLANINYDRSPVGDVGTSKQMCRRKLTCNGYHVPYDGLYDSYNPDVDSIIEIRKNDKYSLPTSTINKVLSCESLREDFRKFIGGTDTNPQEESQFFGDDKDPQLRAAVNIFLNSNLDDDVKSAFLQFASDHNLK